MSKSGSARRYTVANAALWTVSFIVITTRVGMDPLPHPIEIGFRRAIVTLGAFALCEGLWRFLRRLRALPLALQAVVGFGLSALGGLAYGITNHIVMYWFWPRVPPPSGYWDVLLLATMQVWVFLAWCAIVIALAYEEDARAREVQLLSAEKLATESQLAMLRYQLNPHFLFNALNALSELILAQQTRRAERLVLSLSHFLRQALQGTAQTKVRLEDEVWVQQQYLTIEKIRYGARLSFAANMTPEAAAALAPSMILQPLVENAVKHGVARSTGRVRIEIDAERVGANLRITVRDDAEGKPANGATSLGVGLQNIRRRLSVLYGDEGRLEAGPRAPKGFAAQVELPYESAT